MSDHIVLAEVCKFYGEVLGVNRVNLDIPPGLTSLVGPNGSGKTTLMHLMSGLLLPTRGTVEVLGVPPTRPDLLMPLVGYCTQYDSFPAGATGLSFLASTLSLHGRSPAAASEGAWRAIETVGLQDAARRRVAGYSKGMRQRIKLAHALCHEPRVVILDEPLNGLDPMARAEMIELFRHLAAAGRHVVVSSHILHEVDAISDRVVMVHGGSVVAEGSIRAVRGEIKGHPIQVLVRCDRPAVVAARAFELEHVVEAAIVEEGRAVLIRTSNQDRFFAALNRIVLDSGVVVETVAPADETVHAVYDYLIGDMGGGT